MKSFCIGRRHICLSAVEYQNMTQFFKSLFFVFFLCGSASLISVSWIINVYIAVKHFIINTI